MQDTSVMSSVDFEREGVQHGFLKLPHSTDESAWGCIMIPITVVKNGHGPTALLTGGNHGDEYEGITSLLKLSNALKSEQVQGRVIIVPMMNFPAVQNGTRTSPIDKGNLNRAFPGNPRGTITEQIADYFQRYLIPLCDYALDIHSGGKTLDFIPFAAAHRLHNKEQEAQCIAAAKCFGAPNTLVMIDMQAHALYDTAVESAGKVFVSTELGGGGTSNVESIAICDRGIENFLAFSGIVKKALNTPVSSTRVLEMPDMGSYIQSEHRGIIEYCVALNGLVNEGDLIARIFSLERTGVEPELYFAKGDGIVTARHFPGIINIGDTLAVLSIEVDA